MLDENRTAGDHPTPPLDIAHALVRTDAEREGTRSSLCEVQTGTRRGVRWLLDGKGRNTHGGHRRLARTRHRIDRSKYELIAEQRQRGSGGVQAGSIVLLNAPTVK